MVWRWVGVKGTWTVMGLEYPAGKSIYFMCTYMIENHKQASNHVVSFLYPIHAAEIYYRAISSRTAGWLLVTRREGGWHKLHQ